MYSIGNIVSWTTNFVWWQMVTRLMWWSFCNVQKYQSLCLRAFVHGCFRPVRLFLTLWTVVCQAPLSMGFSGQEYWSALPFSTPEDLLNSGIESASLRSPALAGGFFTTRDTWKSMFVYQGLTKCYKSILQKKKSNLLVEKEIRFTEVGEGLQGGGIVTSN